MSDQGRVFGKVAESYDRGRPSYPRTAVEWLVGPMPMSVLELGAGTGKLTRTLVELGHDVHATDPDEAMLDVLRRHLPDVRTSVGSAEQIPAPDLTYDVVVVGQALHWFDLDKALPEIARVLNPGGTLAMAWNERDESIPWVRKLGRLIENPVESADPSEPVLDSGLFEGVEHARYDFWQTIDRSSVVDLVLSRSNLAGRSDEEREAKRREVLAFYDDYGRGMDGMQLPYKCLAYRATVVPRVPGRPVVETPVATTFISSGGSLTDTAHSLPRILDSIAEDRPDPGSTGSMLLIDFR
ncbi:Methyltransferase domain-containing protein [Nocardioides terrae]|uniref:Methyltransferase domain-containing protein n=1 Tax=Nocardioides terrae TaxID=574651 RepID=A0A1I1H5D7_9ACTN|nr:class I SAM-dependent methyltransferase [Nocardioides terrae]SFC17268.1 Methyltransferase domain-containing protein [Nocardioides terrae]